MISFDCALERAGFAFDAAFESAAGVTALWGPSGAGKTTAINLIAGLERPRTGRIALDGEVLLDTRTQKALPAHKRRVGLVFQDARLFPHLNVADNLAYGRWFTPKEQRRIGLGPVVEMLDIGPLLSRRIEGLSGGERQRVALGRALIQSPRLLLMDEPLASLDAERKLEILPFIERVRDEFAIPIIYVSHALEEVARLASYVVKLAQGRVVAAGAPEVVLAQERASLNANLGANRFETASILTAMAGEYVADYGVTLLEHPAGKIALPMQLDSVARRVRVAIRATDVALAIGEPGQLSVRTVLSGRVARIDTDGGAFALVSIALPGGDMLKASATRLAIDSLGVAVGAEVRALVKAVSIDERGVSGVSG